MAAFLAVAQERSFTRAGKRLGVSASALSHSIRGLEERFGVRLLARTTRSVEPTVAGEQLIARLGPALDEIQAALEEITALHERPSGRVRLHLPRIAASMLVAPKLARFARDYPDVVLEITTEDSRVDLVAGHFDAGIHLSEYIERDMIAVRVTHDMRAAIVGSPRYFESHPRPESPRDLLNHRCINIRIGSEGVYHWEFGRGKESLTVAVKGPLNVDDPELLIHAALDGIGLASLFEQHAAPYIASGAFVRVLEDWCPPFAGFSIYYPSRRQQPTALLALIEALRLAEPDQ